MDVLATAILGSSLLFLSIIDMRTLRIPDIGTIPLVLTGLAVNGVRFGAQHAWIFATGGVVGYLTFWLVARGYKKFRHRAGLGLGDAKLLSAAGTWLGVQFLAPTVFIGAVLALSFVGVLRLCGHTVSLGTSVAFGPFLSVAFFALWCLKLFWTPI